MTSVKEKLLAWTWKILLIVAAAVPIFAVVFAWSHNNFEMPMPRTVRDSVLTNPLVFSVFIGLVAISFAVQFFSDSPERRKESIRPRTPILLFIGPIVVLMVSVLAWWQSGSSFARVVSEVAQKPFMLGTITGLTAGSLALAFLMSKREEQKRCFKILLTLTSVFLIFGGPSYLIYGLQAVKLPYHYAALIGLFSFIAGIIIFLRYVPKEPES
jgi:uncharacterized membrane protein YidH (DUF202 family)